MEPCSCSCTGKENPAEQITDSKNKKNKIIKFVVLTTTVGSLDHENEFRFGEVVLVIDDRALAIHQNGLVISKPINDRNYDDLSTQKEYDAAEKLSKDIKTFFTAIDVAPINPDAEYIGFIRDLRNGTEAQAVASLKQLLVEAKQK